MGPQVLRDSSGYVCLDLEDVVEPAVVALRPEMLVRVGLDELYGDSHPIPAPADASLEHRVDVQFGPDVAERLLSLLVRVDRGPRDDPKTGDPGEDRDDLLGHPVGEVRVVRVGTHVRERQHGDPVSRAPRHERRFRRAPR
jgi:hypothetical protein